MTKHTPGPWGSDENNNVWANLNGEDYLIADCNPNTICSKPGALRRSQNARVIAAAPDLLEALKAIVSDAESGQCEMDIITLARAAIAKAEQD